MALPAALATYQAVAWTINWSESFSIHEEDFATRRHLMGRALRTKMATGFCVRAVEYIAALRERRRLALATDALVRSVDALILPGAFHVAPSLREPGTVPAFTPRHGLLGLQPHRAPGPFALHGLCRERPPLNAQVVGRYFDEATVLRVAQAYEAATPWRARKPDPAPHAPEPIMPDPTLPSVSPERLAEAERYAARYGLSGLAQTEMAELAPLARQDRGRRPRDPAPAPRRRTSRPRLPGALAVSEPCFLTAAQASRAIAEGRLSSEALVRSCLERIEARDPAVKAWLHLDPRAALSAAREADKRPRRSPLHGLPFGVKDMIDTVDMPTTHNSANWQGYRPAKDAACVGVGRGLRRRDPRQDRHGRVSPPPGAGPRRANR